MKRSSMALILLGLALTLAGCGSTTSAASTRTKISQVIRRMLVAAYPSVPFSQVPQGSTPTAVVKTRLIAQEKAQLSHIFSPSSQPYRQSLAAYHSALTESGRVRTLQVQATHFHLVSITLNGNKASAEWTASMHYQTASATLWTRRDHQTDIEGTTVLTQRQSAWRVSSTAGTAPP